MSLQHGIDGLKHHRDIHADQAVRRMPRAARGRNADAVAGGTREVDSDDTIQRSSRSIPSRIRWTEHRDDGRSDGLREMHRTCVAGDDQADPLEQSSQAREARGSRQVDHAIGRQIRPDLVDLRTILRGAGEHD